MRKIHITLSYVVASIIFLIGVTSQLQAQASNAIHFNGENDLFSTTFVQGK